MSAVPAFTSPGELAAETGFSERALRIIRQTFGPGELPPRDPLLTEWDAPVGEAYLRLLAYRIFDEHLKGKLRVETARRFLDTKEKIEASLTIDVPEDAPAEARLGLVYFIRSGDAVKIGFTKSLGKRLAGLSTGMAAAPVVLLAQAGTVADERSYHKRFAASRIRREWFHLEGEVDAFLRSVP